MKNEKERCKKKNDKKPGEMKLSTGSNLPVILENFNEKVDKSFDNFKSLDISKFSMTSGDFKIDFKHSPKPAFPKISNINNYNILKGALNEDHLVIHESNDTGNRPVSMYESEYVNISEARLKKLRNKDNLSDDSDYEEIDDETEMPYFINMINPLRHNNEVLSKFSAIMSKSEEIDHKEQSRNIKRVS